MSETTLGAFLKVAALQDGGPKGLYADAKSCTRAEGSDAGVLRQTDSGYANQNNSDGKP